MPVFTEIDTPEVRKRLAEGWAPYILDVRSQGEADVAQIDATDRLIPHTAVTAIAAELPTDRDILVYCRSGVRSALACNALAGVGLTGLFNLSDGILGWTR